MRFFALAALSLSILADDRNQPRGTSGEFDFYLLSLSWSPQYCSSPAGERDKVQCAGSRQYNFVLHGMWPQYNDGSPQYCATNQRLAILDAALADRPPEEPTAWRKVDEIPFDFERRRSSVVAKSAFLWHPYPVRTRSSQMAREVRQVAPTGVDVDAR